MKMAEMDLAELGLLSAEVNSSSSSTNLSRQICQIWRIGVGGDIIRHEEKSYILETYLKI